MSKIPLGVQLYTLRDLTKADMAGTLKQVAEIGYDGVEMAGYGSLGTAAAVNAVVRDLGLKVGGAHIGIDALDKELGRVMDENELLGNPYIVCPGIPPVRRQTPEDWKKIVEIFNRAAPALAERGFKFVYHNHDHELRKMGEKTPHQIIAENMQPQFVKWELDVYWAAFAGIDPVGYMKQEAPRMLMLHLKDMAAGPERHFAEVGTGVLDFPAILAEGKKLGVEWMIVEQDQTYGRPQIEAVATSYRNLRALGM